MASSSPGRILGPTNIWNPECREERSISYGEVRALHGVSLDLSHGETGVLLGTNGNGKSTLLKCIMGMVRLTFGEIILDIDGERHDLARLLTENIVGVGVAMVPEG